ncbi:hypothetical protein ABT336_24615, partial [Micromonospora sp. NPDC000207]|uniref:hypothetical protein n=1 Tax=Micromonospora sp. NPDC000207 TaxID=3154246 RepID=UPI0033193E27
ALRVALHAVVTGGSAAVVLAWQGLAVGQVTTLAVALVVVLHLLPLGIARLVNRRQARGTTGSRP